METGSARMLWLLSSRYIVAVKVNIITKLRPGFTREVHKNSFKSALTRFLVLELGRFGEVDLLTKDPERAS